MDGWMDSGWISGWMNGDVNKLNKDIQNHNYEIQAKNLHLECGSDRTMNLALQFTISSSCKEDDWIFKVISMSKISYFDNNDDF